LIKSREFSRYYQGYCKLIFKGSRREGSTEIEKYWNIKMEIGKLKKFGNSKEV